MIPLPHFEKHHQAVISHGHFILRLLQIVGALLPLIMLSLAVGMVGYHALERMSWIDSLYNAAMIMSGMGPAADLHSDAGKIFASIYALYSGLFLIAVTGYLLSPFFHRVMHKFEKE